MKITLLGEFSNSTQLQMAAAVVKHCESDLGKKSISENNGETVVKILCGGLYVVGYAKDDSIDIVLETIEESKKEHPED
jgi:hypothetical protein